MAKISGRIASGYREIINYSLLESKVLWCPMADVMTKFDFYSCFPGELLLSTIIAITLTQGMAISHRDHCIGLLN